MIWELEHRFAFFWSKVWPAQCFIDIGGAFTNKPTMRTKTFTTASFFLRVMIGIACLIVHVNYNFTTWTVVENKVLRGGAQSAGTGTGGAQSAGTGTGGGAQSTGTGTGGGAQSTGTAGRGKFGSPSV